MMQVHRNLASSRVMQQQKNRFEMKTATLQDPQDSRHIMLRHSRGLEVKEVSIQLAI